MGGDLPPHRACSSPTKAKASKGKGKFGQGMQGNGGQANAWGKGKGCDDTEDDKDSERDDGRHKLSRGNTTCLQPKLHSHQ